MLSTDGHADWMVPKTPMDDADGHEFSPGGNKNATKSNKKLREIDSDPRKLVVLNSFSCFFGV